jgi:hypothetical protein
MKLNRYDLALGRKLPDPPKLRPLEEELFSLRESYMKIALESKDIQGDLKEFYKGIHIAMTQELLSKEAYKTAREWYDLWEPKKKIQGETKKHRGGMGITGTAG